MIEQKVYVVVEDTALESQRIVCETCSRAITELEILEDQYPDRRYTIVEQVILKEGE